MSPFRQIARETRGRLTGHWASALGLLLLPAAVLVFYGYIAGYLLFIGEGTRAVWLGLPVKNWFYGIVVTLGILLTVLVLHPMLLGVIRWWAALAAGHDLCAVSGLYYFKRERYLPALKYTLRLLGCVLLLLLPYLLTVLIVFVLLAQRNLPEVFNLLWSDLSLLTMYQLMELEELLSDVCFWLGPLVYFLLMPLFFADYLYVTHPEPLPIRHSFRLFGRCFYPTLTLFPRYFGWIFLSFFVFPLLYTLPYLGVTYAVFCKWMTRTHT